MRPGYLRDKEDIKYFILYAMSNIPFPVGEADLLDICLIDEAFGYFEYSEAFAELLSSAHVAQQNEGESATFHITPKGRSAAEIFEDDLRKSVKDKAQAAVIRVVRKIRRNSSLVSETQENSDGTFNVKMAIVDGALPVISLDLMVITKRQCALLEANFKNGAEKIYSQILKIMLEDTFSQE